MNRDLENTLDELGPEYRALVGRLAAAYRPADDFTLRTAGSVGCRRVLFRRAALPLAAAVLLVVGVAAVLGNGNGTRSQGIRSNEVIYTAAYAPSEEVLHLIIASQRDDGSWANDFLTRQNAAALRSGTGEAERIAYKKAVRYLHSRGLEPLTDEELRQRGEEAAHRMVRT